MILLLILLIIAVVVIFSIQNAMPAVITFLFWKFEASLAIVIFLSFVAGLVIAALAFYASSLRNYFRKRGGAERRRDEDA